MRAQCAHTPAQNRRSLATQLRDAATRHEIEFDAIAY